jgi:hypothetical protein
LSLRSDDYSGYIQTIIQPSARFSLGVFVSHNDHYSLKVGEPQLTSRDQLEPTFELKPEDVDPGKIVLAVKVLTEMWSDSMNRAARVFERIADQARA